MQKAELGRAWKYLWTTSHHIVARTSQQKVSIHLSHWLGARVTRNSEIRRAARILKYMEWAHSEQIGAIGLVTEKGGKEMIDAPMLKQVRESSC